MYLKTMKYAYYYYIQNEQPPPLSEDDWAQADMGRYV